MNSLNSTAGRWLTLVCCGGFMGLSLCAGGENFNEFRLSAGPGIESGLLAILEGDGSGLESIVDSVISGLFQIFRPD